jgi:hypothetical protein
MCGRFQASRAPREPNPAPLHQAARKSASASMFQVGELWGITFAALPITTAERFWPWDTLKPSALPARAFRSGYRVRSGIKVDVARVSYM